MDAARADSLAASADPKALNALRNRGGDPAVARAVAGQFGSFLMQGMMQDADGSAMSMAGGTGGAAVSSMFASAMSRYAMSGDQLGLADRIYRSMAAKGGPGPDAPKADSVSATANAVVPNATGARSTEQGSGIPLGPYWQLGGHRPFGPPMGHFAAPAGQIAPHRSTDAASAIHRASDTAPSTGSTAVQRGAALPARTHAPAAVGPSASQASASFPWPHLQFLGRELIWQPPIETDTSHAAPSELKSQAAAQPGSNGAAPSGSQTDEPFPWNILDPIGRALIGRPSAELAASSGHAPSTAASTGGVASTSTPRAHGAPARDDGAVTMPAQEPIGHPTQHRADNSTPNSMQAEDFAGEVAPALNQAAARLGVSPRVLLAQAALETGWGHSVVGNNIFGIKAGGSWRGAAVTADTHEVESGRLVTRHAAFRSYATIPDAVDDYVALVTASHRYRGAIGSGDNAEAYGQVLAAGGYASDRDYAAKLEAVADSSTMSYAVGAAEDAAADRRPLAHG